MVSDESTIDDDTGYDDEPMGMNAITDACKNGDHEMLVRLLLEDEPSPKDLITAIENDHIEIVKLLFEDGRIDTNACNSFHMAIHLGNLEIAQVIFENTVTDPTLALEIVFELGYQDFMFQILTDSRTNRRTAWEYARICGHSEVLDSLAITDEEALFWAIEDSDEIVLNDIIKSKKLYPVTNMMLILAVQNQLISTVEWILSYPNIDPNYEDNLAIMIAEELSNSTILRLLLQHPEISLFGLSSVQKAIAREYSVPREVFMIEDLVVCILKFTQAPVLFTKGVAALSNSNFVWKLRYENMEHNLSFFHQNLPECSTISGENDYRSLYHRRLITSSSAYQNRIIDEIMVGGLDNIRVLLNKMLNDTCPHRLNFSRLLSLALANDKPQIALEIISSPKCRLGIVRYLSKEIQFGEYRNYVSYAVGRWEESPDQVTQIFKLAIKAQKTSILSMLYEHYQDLIKSPSALSQHALEIEDVATLAQYLKGSKFFPSEKKIHSLVKGRKLEVLNVLLLDSRFSLSCPRAVIENALVKGDREMVSFLIRCVENEKYVKEREPSNIITFSNAIIPQIINRSFVDQKCIYCKSIYHIKTCPCMPETPLRTSQILLAEDRIHLEWVYLPSRARVNSLKNSLDMSPVQNPITILNCILACRGDDPTVCLKLCEVFVPTCLEARSWGLEEIFQEVIRNDATDELEMILEMTAAYPKFRKSQHLCAEARALRLDKIACILEIHYGLM